MGLGLVWALIGAGIVFLTAPWWGAEVPPWDRGAASLVTAVAGIGLTLIWPFGLLWTISLTGILAVVAVIDRRHHIIPNRVTAVALLWALAARLHDGHWRSAVVLGVAIFLFYLMVHVITHGAGLGMGDVKLAGVLAFGLGYPAGLMSMVAGMWAAGLYAVFLIVTRRRGTGFMALGPFLAFGGFVGLLDLVH